MEKAISGVGKWRPDVLSITKNGVIRITEVVSPSQTASDIVNKVTTMANALTSQGYKVVTSVVDEAGKIIK